MDGKGRAMLHWKQKTKVDVDIPVGRYIVRPAGGVAEVHQSIAGILVVDRYLVSPRSGP